MKPVPPEELSGLIDGELLPERAIEVRNALEQDPQLRKEYEHLLACHVNLASFANESLTSAMPRMACVLEQRSNSTNIPAIRLLTGMVIGIRVVDKMVPQTWGIALSLVGVAIVVVGVTRWLMGLSDEQAGARTVLTESG